MIEATQVVLLIGFEDGFARKVVRVLAPLGVHFQRLPWPTAVADPSWLFDADAVIFHHQGDRSLLAWLSRFGGWSSDGRRAGGVVALASDDRAPEIERHVGRGVCRVVRLDGVDRSLRDVVGELLAVERRFRVRVPVRLLPAPDGGGEATVCTTENVSRSGLLLRTGRPLDAGSIIRFEIPTPDPVSPIVGLARVVRASHQERDGVEGFAARFELFFDRGQQRLGSLLSRQLC